MPTLDFLLAHPPSIAAWIVMAFSLGVVGGGVVGTRQSFTDPKDNVALAYGVAGLLAVLVLLAVGQGGYAADMMRANATALTLPVDARPGFMAEQVARGEANFLFAGLGSAVALPIASFLFLRYAYLRRERLPEGASHSIHPLEAGRFERPGAPAPLKRAG